MNRFVTVFMMLALAKFAYANEEKTIGNATELRQLLLSGHQAAQLEIQAAQRGCGPNGCSIDIAGVSIMRDGGALLNPETKKHIEIKPQSSGELPEIDWDPLGGYTVTRASKRWGSCLEFTHAGLGKSGRFQRWTSVLLVPWSGQNTGQVAYRFVGYWAGCDVLTEGDNNGEISLPVIEPVDGNKEKTLQLRWYSCTALDCKKSEDPRMVRENSDSETGALIISPN